MYPALEQDNDPIHDIIVRYPVLSQIENDIRSAADMLISCFKGGRGILLCGNGGSAADADHWSGELLKGFESRRPLTGDGCNGLEAGLAGKLQGGLPAIPLTGFTALRSAVANDMDPHLEYAQLVEALAQEGWILIALSTSGNAANVCHAAAVARARNMKVLGLSGQHGGQLKDLCDLCVCVPAQRTCIVQEMHLPIYHAICLSIEHELFTQTPH